jgi:hypothetical protein
MSDQKKPTDTAPAKGQATDLDEDQLENVAGGAALPTESISFNYSKIDIKSLPGDPDGGGEIAGQIPGRYPLRKK